MSLFALDVLIESYKRFSNFYVGIFFDRISLKSLSADYKKLVYISPYSTKKNPFNDDKTVVNYLSLNIKLINYSLTHL